MTRCGFWYVFVVCTVITSLPSGCQTRTADEWKSRIIYQILTDRFGPSGPAPSSPCRDLRSYCGGTFRGIQQRIDYIQGLGANAIWISPFVENTEGGYHGYWAKNLYSVNPHMGTEQELLDLVAACHQRDVWVMMDVVANHMGHPTGTLLNFTDFVPFNETWHYHKYCVIKDWLNQTEVELCRLDNLGDLNQSVSYVHDRLLDWLDDVTEQYGFDGYRVDTVTLVPKWFWYDYTARAEVFLMGEANNGDRTCYTGAYQGPLPSVLNFPLYWAMRRVFNERKPMTELTDSLTLQRECFTDVSFLGVFVDNHDFPRFLNLSDDVALLSNALTYVMFGQGIPIIYYGTEQGFHGGQDPNNRESLWPHQSNTSSLYTFLSGLSSTRKRSRVDFSALNQVELFVDDQLLVFTRGSDKQLLVALTNAGKHRSISRTLTELPFKDGTRYINVENSSDSIEVQQSSFTLQLQSGIPKVYSLQYFSTGEGTNSSRSSTKTSDVTTICVLVKGIFSAVTTFLQFFL